MSLEETYLNFETYFKKLQQNSKNSQKSEEFICMPNVRIDFLELLEEGKWQVETDEQAEQVIFCQFVTLSQGYDNVCLTNCVFLVCTVSSRSSLFLVDLWPLRFTFGS